MQFGVWGGFKAVLGLEMELKTILGVPHAEARGAGEAYRADLTLRKSHFLKLQLPKVPHFLNFKKLRVTFTQKVWLG